MTSEQRRRSWNVGLRTRLVLLLWALISLLVGGQTVAWISSEVTELQTRIATQGTILAQGVANSCSTILQGEDADRFEYLIRRVSRTVDLIDLTIADRAGRIVGHSDRKKVGQEADEGPSGVFGTPREHPGLTGLFESGTHYRASAPVMRATEVIGYVTVRFRSGEVMEHALDLLRFAAGTAIAWLLIGTFVGSLFVRHITRPLAELTEAVRTVSEGDLAGVHIDAPETFDEIGVLQGSFAHLIGALRQQEARNSELMDELRALNAQLQQRVDAVTVDLRETTAYLQSIIHCMEEGVITCDRDGRIVQANAGARRQLVGLGEPDPGKHVAEMVAGAPQLGRAVRQAIDAGRSSDLEITLRSDVAPWHEQAGRELAPVRGDRCLQCRAYPLRGAQGQLMGAVLTVIDISERKTVETALHRGDRLASLGIMAAGLAHELGNNMNAIHGFSVLALRSMDKEDPVRSDVEAIHNENRRAVELLERFLQFARVEEGNVAPRQIATLVREAVGMCDYRMREAAVRKNIDFEEETVLVACDPQPMVQIFVNLVLNAVDAMEGRADKELTITGRRYGDRVVISVKDTGPGVPAEHVERIFDPFFTTKANSGTGLGLAITHQVITRHGGTIRVSNAPGGGAVFDVTLPWVGPDSEQTEEQTQ